MGRLHIWKRLTRVGTLCLSALVIVTTIGGCDEGGSLADEDVFKIKLNGRWRTGCAALAGTDLFRINQYTYDVDEYTRFVGYFVDEACEDQIHTGLVRGVFAVSNATKQSASFAVRSKFVAHAFFREEDVANANATNLCGKEDWEAKAFGAVNEDCLNLLPVITDLSDRQALEISDDSAVIRITDLDGTTDALARIDNCPDSNRHEGCF